MGLQANTVAIWRKRFASHGMMGARFATPWCASTDPEFAAYAAGQHDALAMPSAGKDTLFNNCARLVSGEAKSERGDHAVF